MNKNTPYLSHISIYIIFSFSTIIVEKIILNLSSFLSNRKRKNKNRYFILKSPFQKTIYFIFKKIITKKIAFSIDNF